MIWQSAFLGIIVFGVCINTVCQTVYSFLHISKALIIFLLNTTTTTTITSKMVKSFLIKPYQPQDEESIISLHDLDYWFAIHYFSDKIALNLLNLKKHCCNLFSKRYIMFVFVWILVIRVTVIIILCFNQSN